MTTTLGPPMLVPRLRAIQDEHGFLPDRELEALAAATGTPLYRVQELVSFFPHFRPEWQPPPHVHVQVCRDYTCHLRGSRGLLGPDGLGAFARGGDHAVVVEGVSCLGRCDRGPAVCVSRHGDFHDRVYAGRTAADLERIVEAVVAGKDAPAADADADYLPHANPYEIDVYARRPELEPYAAVRMFLEKHPQPVPAPTGLKPADVSAWLKANYPLLAELEQAGLLGMGGAGVPVFRKWFDVWLAAGDEKYIVCNGDESEPGTFKDREILLRMPHLVVEGVILAGLVTNATAGHIFIRHEYHEQIHAVEAEIRRAVALNVCGDDIGKTGRRFPVSVFVSPGGYICGEQSALLEAMSDRRAQPRNRPPELATNGLHDKPTVVNNVESLAWTPAVAVSGGAWYASQSAKPARGRRLFSISGDLDRPGVYEVPVSATLGELIELAGGITGGRAVGAVATSGPSGGLLPPLIPVPPDDVLRSRIAEALAGGKQTLEAFLAENWTPYLTAGAFDLLKLPLDLNLYKLYSKLLGVGGGKTPGLLLGAGIGVYAADADVLAAAVGYTEFFRNESCGKCVPCRIGSQKLATIGGELLDLRVRGRLDAAAVDRARETIGAMAEAMTATSICSLGQVAASPLASALEYFGQQEE